MILYLILSHRGPDQVLRLARRIIADDPHATVVIHQDAASAPIGPIGDGRIRCVPDRVRVTWGDISVVTALLHSLDWIEREELPYRWMVLLSGQDYPATHLGDLERRLDCGGVDGYLEHAPAGRAFAEENRTRYAFDYRRLPDALSAAVRRMWRVNGAQPLIRLLATRAGVMAGLPSRAPFGAGLDCFRGSFWWTLSRACIAYIRTYVAERPEIVAAFAKKLIPDEAFVPSILASSGRFVLAAADPRFIVWPADNDGSPAVLRERDFDAIVGSGKAFARKFDAAVDGGILDRLDVHAGWKIKASVSARSPS